MTSKARFTKSGFKYRDAQGGRIEDQHMVCSIFTSSLQEISKIFEPEEILDVRGRTSLGRRTKKPEEIPIGLTISESRDIYGTLNYKRDYHGLFQPKKILNRIHDFGLEDFPIYYLRAEVTAPGVVDAINEVYDTNINCQLIAEFKSNKPENNTVEEIVRSFPLNANRISKERFKVTTLNLVDLIDHDQLLNRRRPNYFHYIDFDPNKLDYISRYEITREIQTRLNKANKEKYVMLKQFKPTLSGKLELVGVSK